MGVAASKAAQAAMGSHHAGNASLVIGPERKPAEPMVVFYQLARKFVDTAKSTPDRVTDIMYYTLAVGHHTGVIDCFDEALSCTVPVYERVCGALDSEDARYKLEGILRSGEIQVDPSNLSTLEGPVSAALAAAEPRSSEADFMQGLMDLFQRMECDPALYLMGRKRMP